MAHIDGMVQHCSISSALAMEMLQSCTQPSVYASLNLDIFAPVDGFTTVRRQAITGNNKGSLSIPPLETLFRENIDKKLKIKHNDFEIAIYTTVT